MARESAGTTNQHRTSHDGVSERMNPWMAVKVQVVLRVVLGTKHHLGPVKGRERAGEGTTEPGSARRRRG
jgi:hypothetical protein